MQRSGRGYALVALEDADDGVVDQSAERRVVVGVKDQVVGWRDGLEVVAYKEEARDDLKEQVGRMWSALCIERQRVEVEDCCVLVLERLVACKILC